MEKALGLPEGQTVQVFEVEAGKYTCQAGDTLFEFTLHDLQAAETPLACIKQRYAAAQAAKGR